MCTGSLFDMATIIDLEMDDLDVAFEDEAILKDKKTQLMDEIAHFTRLFAIERIKELCK